MSMIELFAATTSAAWSHDLRVSKISEGTRKRGQKDGDEDEVEEGGGGGGGEDGRGGEGIYTIVVVQRAAGNMQGALRGLPVSVQTSADLFGEH